MTDDMFKVYDVLRYAPDLSDPWTVAHNAGLPLERVVAPLAYLIPYAKRWHGSKQADRRPGKRLRIEHLLPIAPCAGGLHLFDKHFPSGVNLDVDGLAEAASAGLDVCFLILLLPEAEAITLLQAAATLALGLGTSQPEICRAISKWDPSLLSPRLAWASFFFSSTWEFYHRFFDGPYNTLKQLLRDFSLDRDFSHLLENLLPFIAERFSE